MPLRILRARRQRLELRPAAARRRRDRGPGAGRSTGASARSSSFSTSPQMRSAGRSSSGVARHTRPSSSSTRHSNRAANCSARSTRRLSSPNVCASTIRSTRRSRSARPPCGSRYSPVSGSQPIALMVKSRRRAASSNGSDGSPWTSKPVVPAADLRFAARQRHVEALHLEDGEALANGVDRSPLPEQRLQVAGRQPEHLEVEVLGGMAEQRVAHAAADDQARPPRRGRSAMAGEREWSAVLQRLTRLKSGSAQVRCGRSPALPGHVTGPASASG